MNNINLIVNVCYILIYCGVLGFLNNYLSKHIKNKHFVDGLKIAKTIASQLVAKYANDPAMPKAQRREAVTHDLKVALDMHGYHFNSKYLIGVAEHAYQVYKNNGGNIVDAEKVVDPVINDVKSDAKDVAKDDINQAEHVTLNKQQLSNILTKNKNDTLNKLQAQGLINK